MKIRDRLTLLFLLIVGLIMGISSMVIYFSSADYRRDEFYNRIYNKSNNTAKLLIEVDEVDLNLLKRIEKDNPASLPEEQTVIYNYRNQVLYSTDGYKRMAITNALLDKIRLAGEVKYKQGEYEIYGYLFIDKYDRFVVISGAIDQYGLSKLQNLLNVLIAVFIGSLLITFVTGLIFAKRALNPISKVIKQVDNIGITNLNARVEEGNGLDEIAQLAQAFNNVLERLETAFKVQKNFIANASHELRTPLTAITGHMEVTLRQVRSPEDYQKTIESALEDMKNLNNLSNKLLLLAQASAESVETGFVLVRLDEVLWQVASDLQKHNPHYKIQIVLEELDAEQMTVLGNEQLLKTAILNLMENGCKYSANHQVNISIIYLDGGPLLRFEDQGIGIAKEDIPHIFQPFLRGRNTHQIKGHGIGLSLVDRIAHLHKAQLWVWSSVNEGSRFEMHMKASKTI